MKTAYVIVLWIGSNDPSLDVEYFELSDTKKALEHFKYMIEQSEEYRNANPEDNGMPYMSIQKWNEETGYFVEYGNGTFLFDDDYCSLPKYVQKKCSALIEYDRSDK